MPAFRPTLAIPSRIAGGTSKNLCSPTAGRARRAVQKETMSNSLLWPRSYGPDVGASSKSPATSLWRKSRPVQSWQARGRGLCTTVAGLSGSWSISLPRRTAKRQPHADYNSCARISTLGQTIIGRRCPDSLTSTGIKPGGIGGKRVWESIGVGPLPSRGCVCSADWRKTTTASGPQQLDNTICRYSRRYSTFPSTLQRL